MRVERGVSGMTVGCVINEKIVLISDETRTGQDMTVGISKKGKKQHEKIDKVIVLITVPDHQVPADPLG